MQISRESWEQTDRRLRRVAAATAIAVHDASWWFEEFPLDQFPACARPDAIALVRDMDCWSQLVPVLANDRPSEQFRIWSCHFPAGIDNSGFVGWLATHIKVKTGSGIFVVCGRNSSRGGIYDYWGCPMAVFEDVIREVRAITSGGGEMD